MNEIRARIEKGFEGLGAVCHSVSLGSNCVDPSPNSIHGFTDS